jgi:LysR family nitrogen assimilation transcriptional regulator
MELRQLRYFIGISEAGSLLKASTRLHVAQPSLSQQVAALEHSVGARLFERSSRGITLTDAGKVFFEHAKVVLADVERARTAVRDTASVVRGDVAIGLTTTVGLVATVPILRACRDRHPEVRLKIVEAYSGYVREWLQTGRLDLAILYGDNTDPGLAKRPLLDDRMVLVTSGTGDSSPKALSLASISRWPLVLPGREHGLRRLIDDACAPLGIELQVVAEIDSLNSVKRAVAAGIGNTILPLGAVAEDIAAGRLRASHIERPSIVRRVFCATSATRPTTTAAAAVMTLLVEVLGGMVRRDEWPARWIGEPASTRQTRAD